MQRLSLRIVLGTFVVAAMAAVWPAQGQTYPSRQIRILVPYAPGGGNDTAARVVGKKLGEALGQQVVVDNRPGGGSVIASEIAAKAPPDGHTLYLVSTAFTVAPTLYEKLPFDTLKDFTAITRVAIAPGAVIVHPSLPVNSVRELIALAKHKPNEITFGSAGIGSGSHLGGELFRHLTGTEIVHVPYRGSSLATTAILSGEVAVAFTNPVAATPLIRAGRLRMIAVTTPERWPLLPQVPTVAEAGVPGYELLIWNGMVVPAGTAQPVVTRLHSELVRALSNPGVIDILAHHGSRVSPESPTEFSAFLRTEVEKWRKVIRRDRVTVN